MALIAYNIPGEGTRSRYYFVMVDLCVGWFVYDRVMFAGDWSWRWMRGGGRTVGRSVVCAVTGPSTWLPKDRTGAPFRLDFYCRNSTIYTYEVQRRHIRRI